MEGESSLGIRPRDKILSRRDGVFKVAVISPDLAVTDPLQALRYKGETTLRAVS